MKAIITAILLIASLMFIGFVIAGGVTAKFFVSTADGMAGGAIVFFYGLFGALFGLIMAIFLLKRLKPEQKQALALLGTIISIVAVFVFQRRFEERKSEQEDQELRPQTQLPSPA